MLVILVEWVYYSVLQDQFGVFAVPIAWFDDQGCVLLTPKISRDAGQGTCLYGDILVSPRRYIPSRLADQHHCWFL